MRRENNVWKPEQWIILGGRLLLEYVQRRAGDPALRERLNERRLVHHRAAGGVDEKRGSLHATKLGLSHQVARLVRERAVNGKHVRLSADLLEAGSLHARFDH